MKKLSNFLSELYILDELNIVKPWGQYHTLSNKRKKQLYKKILQKLRKGQISANQTPLRNKNQK